MGFVPHDLPEQELCKSCGLCCDGTFFDYVEVVEERSISNEKYSKNNKLEIEVKTTKKFKQPCSCFDSKLGCSIYSDRPKVCVNFKCGLLKQLSSDKKSLPSCLKVVSQLKNNAIDINKKLESKASFIKSAGVLKKFTLVYGNIDNSKSMQKLGRQDASLLKYYMGFAMAYQEFFPKRKLLPLLVTNKKV